MSQAKKPQITFLLCHGQRDSHAATLADGRPNNSARTGQPYEGVTWPELLALAAEPGAVAKAKAPSAIFSTYREADARGFTVQAERGRFGLLVLDIDSGGPSLEAVGGALGAVLGDAGWLAYSSASACPEAPKWRALVPLAELVAGADWPEIQAAFFDCLEALGLEPDRAFERTGQIAFLPNVPPERRVPEGAPVFYQWRHADGPALRLNTGPIAARLAERAGARAEAEREAAKRREAVATNKAARLASDTLSPIEAFNAQNTVAEMLAKHWFTQEPRGIFQRDATANWASPYQVTGHALRNFGAYWVTFSRADAEAGLGIPTKSGARWGDAFSLFCHFEHRGDVAAAVAAYGAELRAALLAQGANGRFVGAGALATDKPAAPPEWLDVAEAADRIRKAVAGALDNAAAGLEGPVVAVAASPGAGKSRIAREVIAERLAQLGGDVAFYCPTLDLAKEAAAHFEELGVRALVVRGREAARPDGGGPMCQRAGLVGVLKKAGLEIGANICRRKGAGAAMELCPHHAACPWVAQWQDLDAGPVVRCFSHAHLFLPDASGRGEPVLRVIDESCWGAALGQADVALAGWLGLRRCEPGLAADINRGAATVLDMLREGTGLSDLPYSAEDMRAFAAGEGGNGVIHAGPSASDAEIRAAAAMRGDTGKGGGARAAVWRILAEAKEAGRDDCERVVRTDAGLRVFWRKAMPSGLVVVLDADADAEILGALWPGRAVDLVRAELRPVADVVQVTDRAFSKRALLGVEGAPGGAELRAELVGLVRLEVLRQRAEGGGGVLAVASKAVVRQIFADAGREDFSLGAELHGACWAWYGPATRGLNDWRGFGAVVLIGREELPPDALTGQARALYGDGAEALDLPKPNAAGAVLAPEAALPVLMADGTARAIVGRAYSDRRLRALQMQHRERGLRQAAERLRLAHADKPKRVLVLSRVPVPGLPVAALVAWSDLAPDRLRRAMAEATLGAGILRTSAAGLAADAPETFPNMDAAKVWLRRGGSEQIKWGLAPNIDSLGASPHLIAIPALARSAKQRGRATPILVLTTDRHCGAEQARAMAEKALGPLDAFELLASAPEVGQNVPDKRRAAHLERGKYIPQAAESFDLVAHRATIQRLSERLQARGLIPERKVAAAPP